MRFRFSDEFFFLFDEKLVKVKARNNAQLLHRSISWKDTKNRITRKVASSIPALRLSLSFLWKRHQLIVISQLVTSDGEA